MRILMIHGIAQQNKNPEELKAIWTETLKKGFKAANINLPLDVQFDFPYYGDKLYQFTSQADLPTPKDVARKGPGQDKEYEQFMQSMLSEMKLNAGIADAEVEAVREGDTLEKGIQNWPWVQAIARVIDRYWTDASDFTIETFLKDVYLYVNKPAITHAINKIIEEKLTDEPTLVIGHSLGSVVGYKVITDNLSKLNLLGYITVGSPLGLKAITSKLGLLQNPGGPNGWYNAFDKRDIVAINPLDDRNFPTDPDIVNYSSVNNHTDNRHGIIGYLDDVNVAKQVAKALK